MIETNAAPLAPKDGIKKIFPIKLVRAPIVLPINKPIFLLDKRFDKTPVQ
jgi:hypothetical protein